MCKNKPKRIFLASLLVIISLGQLQGQITFTQSSENVFKGINGTSNPPYLGPSFADLDGDLDFDAVMCPLKFPMYTYFENIGTTTQPEYKSKYLTVPSNGTFHSAVDFADLDNDQDLDMIKSSEIGLSYYQNTGNVNDPVFNRVDGTANPFGTFATIETWIPVLIDIDADGDEDLFFGTLHSDEILYFENSGTSSIPLFIQKNGVLNPFYEINPILEGAEYTAIDFSDLDKDGDFDAVLACSKFNYLTYIENTGNHLIPEFITITHTSPVSEIQVKKYPSISLVDLDNDADEDLAIAYNGNVTLYINNPIVTSANPNKTSNQFQIYPNPATDNLNVNLLIDGFQIFTIFNSNGIEVFSKKIEYLNNNKVDLGINHLEKGFYILNILNEQGISSVKFLKQ